MMGYRIAGKEKKKKLITKAVVWISATLFVSASLSQCRWRQGRHELICLGMLAHVQRVMVTLLHWLLQRRRRLLITSVSEVYLGQIYNQIIIMESIICIYSQTWTMSFLPINAFTHALNYFPPPPTRKIIRGNC